ncbi:hypothetical protein A0J57_23125 [Sphingobium sp. 22B]|nr:hypothetical protein AXW74_22835 [Sphingobium sp. AM]KYC29959.1 hypothetical protein A0J57_23125 [Sphingobium sp. 22B]OAP30019.1 hypothetical protein A8O16_20685 [Sphingobium sp. 20006FA]
MENLMKKITPVLCLAILSACTTPADVSKPLTAGSDKNATFNVQDTANGFTVDVRYSRYQFIPEADALLVACRSIATSRAYEEAKRRGRDIQPINEQTIRVSTGRNAFNGRTACRAFVEAVWKEA